MAVNVVLSFAVPTQDEINDFCTYHGYQATVPDPEDPEKTIPNPETRAVFAKKQVINFFRNSIKAQRSNAVAEAARKAKITQVEALVIE